MRWIKKLHGAMLLGSKQQYIIQRATWWMPLLLFIFAVFYYATYYRSGLNLSGEGGTTAIIAMRLMEGQRPIIDTFLGYNVMWFYPIVWLFEWTGPHYITLRLFFFALCTVTALVGYFTVLRATRQLLLAFFVGAFLIVIPGMMFRNYMGFMGVLNIFFMLHAFVWVPKQLQRRFLWVLLSTGMLTLTYLIRIDIGLFLTPIWLGLLISQLFGDWKGFPRRMGIFMVSLLIGLLVFVALHIPVFQDAQKRGFSESLAGQYTALFKLICYEWEQKVIHVVFQPKASVPSTANVGIQDRQIADAALHHATESLSKAENHDGVQDETVHAGTLFRPSLFRLFQEKSFYDTAFTGIIYLPLIIAVCLLISGMSGFVASLWLQSEGLRREALIMCATTGISLAFFPQYFFFRPDTPHLSEFMCSFVVAMVCSSFVIYQWMGRWKKGLIKWVGYLILSLCILNIVLYVYHSIPKESAGTAVAGRKRMTEFYGQNGVNVFLRPLHAAAMQHLHDTIMSHSDRDDWVVCYPYAPTVNFMTNRPSFEYNLYVDNATASPRFDANTIAKLQKFKPAVIVVNNREINAVKSSRFRIWAKSTYEFIRKNYIYMGTFHRNEVFVRPDKVVGFELAPEEDQRVGSETNSLP